MSSGAAVDSVVEALAQAERALPTASLYRPWLEHVGNDLREARSGRPISPAEIYWLKVRLEELERLPVPRPRLAISYSLAAIRLRRAARLARRASPVLWQGGGNGLLAVYLAGLDELLAAIARRLDHEAGVFVRCDLPVLPLAPG